VNSIQDYFYKQTFKRANNAKVLDPILEDYLPNEKIGVVFCADHEKDWEAIATFIDELKQQEIDVQVLAYISKEIRLENFHFDYISSKDLNWYHIPKMERLESFINQDFDYLFNLHPQSHRTLDFISKISKSRIKVGPEAAAADCYDIMIDGTYKEELGLYLYEFKSTLQHLSI